MQVVQVPPGPTNKRKKSVVWDFFTLNGEGSAVICNICEADIKVNPDPNKGQQQVV